MLKLSKDQRLDEKQKESLKNVMLFILAITNLQVKEYIKENSKEIINLANALKKEKSVDLLKEKIQNSGQVTARSTTYHATQFP